jgi:hypothetical protein
MGQKVKSYKLDTKTARKALKPRGKPYWARIREGLHLGYRRSLYGGAWVARRYLGNGKYVTENVARADDFKIDGELVSFDRAQEILLKVAEEARKLTAAGSAGPYTVNAALDAYFARLEAEGSKSVADAKGRAAFLIRPELGEIPVFDRADPRDGRGDKRCRDGRPLMDTKYAGKTSEQYAREFLEFIEEGARRSLKFEKLIDDDRETLEMGLDRLRPAVNKLCRLFIDPMQEVNPVRTMMGIVSSGQFFFGHGLSELKQTYRKAPASFVASQNGKEKPKPEHDKIIDELNKGTPTHLIAKRLGLTYNNAFKQLVCRLRKAAAK